MKHKLHFFITTYLLLTVTSCCAMELKSIKNHCGAHYLADNNVVIICDDKYSVVDPATDKEIISINNPKTTKIALDQNKKKIAFVSNKAIKIYDIKTGTQEWETALVNGDEISAIHLSTLDKAVFVSNRYGNTLRYNSDNTIKYDYTKQCNSSSKCPIIVECHTAFHPTEKRMCMISDLKSISIVRTNDFLEEKKLYFESKTFLNFCIFSPDGSFLAVDNQRTVYIINTNTYAVKPIFVTKETQGIKPHKEQLHRILFHPNGSILATLSNWYDRDYTLCYWDITTHQLITTMRLEITSPSRQINLSFSPAGTNIMFQQPFSITIHPVPFEVIYQANIKQKLPYLLFLLKNYQVHQNNIVPQEITQLLLYNLLATFKR